MAPNVTFPVSDINLLLRACRASEPLEPGDPRWYDFSGLRHARVLPRLERVFSGSPEEGEFHHRVLCGHRGCGKSTELLRFKQWADENDFACARIEVNVEIGNVQLEFSDFFLLAAQAAERVLKDLGDPLSKDALEPILEWFAEITQEDTDLKSSELAVEAVAQLGGSAPFGLAKLFAKFSSGLKAGSSHAVKIRRRLRNYPDRLIDLTNALLEEATQKLRKLSRDCGLVLLFDNLDRYKPTEIDEVLMQGSGLLEKMGCHALYIIPIDLEYKPLSGPLRDAYGPPIVLPMIPLRDDEHPWGETVDDSVHLEEAVEGMRHALAQRLQLGAIFENESDADRLIRMSGGCIRDLMHLVTLAFEMSTGDQLTTKDCNLAIQELRATYSRELALDHYERLAAIAHRREVPRDDLTQELLFNRWALEYSKPEGGVWIDVHPLVIEIEEFRDVYHRTADIST